MYKDLSLKEKAKVIREGVRLGLNSIDDILSLYDEAIGHTFQTKGLMEVDTVSRPSLNEYLAKRAAEEQLLYFWQGSRDRSEPHYLLPMKVAIDKLRINGFLKLRQEELNALRFYETQIAENSDMKIPEIHRMVEKNVVPLSISEDTYLRGLFGNAILSNGAANNIKQTIDNGYFVDVLPANCIATATSNHPYPGHFVIGNDQFRAYSPEYGWALVDKEDARKGSVVSQIPNHAVIIDDIDDSGKIYVNYSNGGNKYKKHEPLWESNNHYYNFVGNSADSTRWTNEYNLLYGTLYTKGGPIVSPYGQWKYPGKDTIIPSNNITMDNVNYPVLGISDTGDTKVMMPWNDYKFRGSMVYEHPLIGNQFQLGGNTKPTFDLWYPTVPKQKNDTSSYNLRRAYDMLPFDEMEKFRTIDDYHLPSVAYDEKTDTYTFLKRNGHPTLNYELDWYNSGSPDALEFRERYKLDTLSLPWRYVPRTYLEGGKTLNYLNVPEYNIALYNSISPLGDFPNLWEALAYKREVKDKLKNGNIYERDYKVGDSLGEKTAMAAWAKRLGLPYDEQDLPVYNGDTVTLPYSLVLEIPYDTNMLKNRIQLNKALLNKYSKYRYSDVVNAAIKADLYNLDKLRETYKTGKPVGLTEFGWNSRLLVNNGEIVPIEEIQSPLNVLGNYNVRYSPEERRLYYSDEYDFNQFENFVPGEPFRIRGYIDLDNNKALGGNLFKKGGIYINPKNKGKFNATKKRTGKTTEELTHSKNPLTRKRAIFALNAKKWHHKHDDGGYLYSEGGFLLAPYLYIE